MTRAPESDPVDVTPSLLARPGETGYAKAVGPAFLEAG